MKFSSSDGTRTLNLRVRGYYNDAGGQTRLGEGHVVVYSMYRDPSRRPRTRKTRRIRGASSPNRPAAADKALYSPEQNSRSSMLISPRCVTFFFSSILFFIYIDIFFSFKYVNVPMQGYRILHITRRTI